MEWGSLPVLWTCGSTLRSSGTGFNSDILFSNNEARSRTDPKTGVPSVGKDEAMSNGEAPHMPPPTAESTIHSDLHSSRLVDGEVKDVFTASHVSTDAGACSAKLSTGSPPRTSA